MMPRPSSAPRVRSTRALDIFAVVCATVAVLLLVWPTPNGVTPTSAARIPTASPAAPSPVVDAPVLLPDTTRSENDSLIAVIVNGNLFSATRKAPATRFVPPGEPATTAESAPDYRAMKVAPVTNDSLPALSGIVAVNGERQALLQMTAADDAPKLYRINESHAGYRVVQIGPDMVILASRAGTRTLRLARSAPPDSLEKLP